MIDLHPEFLTKNGQKQFAVIPYEEFVKLQELLEDLEDLKDIKEAKEEYKNTPNIPFEEVKEMFNLP
ncbi:MAG: type II toxin-antitoxin system Phd/YefM family antitoxin [Xenococcaceae cyanobacterium]